MDLSTTVLGTHTVDLLKARVGAAVLTIGRDTFTRGELAGVSCFNYVAALNLSRACVEVGAKSVRDVFDNVTPRMLALPHVGAVSLAVLGAAFEAKGIGGEPPLVNWVTKHRDIQSRKAVATFDTIKAHAAEMHAAKQDKRAAKARTRGRQDKARRLRVNRFSRRVGQDQHAD